MRLAGILLAVFSFVHGSARAADIPPLLTTTGKSLINEDFSGAALPATLRTLNSPDGFRAAAGALEIISQAGQERSTHGVIMVSGRDLTVAFSVKFTKPGALYIGIDGYKESFKGNTHLVRFSLTPERMAWDQKRGGPESKLAVGEAAKAARSAKQPIPQPTPEQLADPNFFRTEELAARNIRSPVGEYHQVLLEVSGNELVAQVDGQTLLATATEADTMKNRIGIGLTGRCTVILDEVRVWENARRDDWQAVKSKLTEQNAVQP